MDNLPQEIAAIILDYMRNHPVFYQLDRERSALPRMIGLVNHKRNRCRIQIKQLPGANLLWSTWPFGKYIKTHTMKRLFTAIIGGAPSLINYRLLD